MAVLSKAKEFNPQLITKSSIMLGLGETDKQIELTLKGNYCTKILLQICENMVSLSPGIQIVGVYWHILFYVYLYFRLIFSN